MLLVCFLSRLRACLPPVAPAQDRVLSNVKQWKEHVVAMKLVDPEIKVFFNYNRLMAKSLRQFLTDVTNAVVKLPNGTNITGTMPNGKYIVDGAEFHGKWPSSFVK